MNYICSLFKKNREDLISIPLTKIKYPKESRGNWNLTNSVKEGDLEIDTILSKCYKDFLADVIIVKKIYLAVFLSGEILDKIFQQNISDALIFLHHPMDMESSGRGFLPVEEKYFLKLKRRRISIYCLHTPLDINNSRINENTVSVQLVMQVFMGI